MRLTNYLALLVIISGLVGFATILALPSTMDYSVLNNGETGFSELVRYYNASILTSPKDLESLNPEEYVLLVGGVGGLSSDVLARYKLFVEKGGVIIVTGDTVLLNSVAEAFGRRGLAGNGTIYDMVFNAGNRFKPKGYSRACNCTVAVWKPSPLLLNGGSGLVETSSFSYLDLNNNGFMDLEEPIGSFPISLMLDYGDGKVVIIASPRVFTNDMLEENKEFLDFLKGSRSLIIDQIVQSKQLFERVRLAASRTSSVLLTGILSILLVTVIMVAGSKR
jgi:hypothetical protein